MESHVENRVENVFRQWRTLEIRSWIFRKEAQNDEGKNEKKWGINYIVYCTLQNFD